MNGKINFLTFQILQSKGKKIVFLDFDTTISSLIKSKILNFEPKEYFNLNLIIPHEKEIPITITKVLDLLQCDSMLIIDSINGLIDCLNFKNTIYKYSSNSDNRNKTSTIHPNNRSGAYQALTILQLLRIKTEYKKIPILITCYQSYSRMEILKRNLFDHDTLQTNHFIKLAKSIILLEYLNNNNTGISIYKKEDFDELKKQFNQQFFPLSLYLVNNHIKTTS